MQGVVEGGETYWCQLFIKKYEAWSSYLRLVKNSSYDWSPSQIDVINFIDDWNKVSAFTLRSWRVSDFDGFSIVDEFRVADLFTEASVGQRSRADWGWTSREGGKALAIEKCNELVRGCRIGWTYRQYLVGAITVATAITRAPGSLETSLSLASLQLVSVSMLDAFTVHSHTLLENLTDWSRSPLGRVHSLGAEAFTAWVS